MLFQLKSESPSKPVLGLDSGIEAKLSKWWNPEAELSILTFRGIKVQQIKGSPKQRSLNVSISMGRRICL